MKDFETVFIDPDSRFVVEQAPQGGFFWSHAYLADRGRTAPYGLRYGPHPTLNQAHATAVGSVEYRG